MILQREILQSVRMDGFIVDHKVPELRLWVAIVLTSIEEYEGWLKRIQTQWLLHGQPVAYEYGSTIRRLRFELEHEWFRHICDLANREHCDVIARIASLEKRYGFHNVRFADMGPVKLKKTRKEQLSYRKKFRRNA